MMRELRILNVVLDQLGIRIRAEWIPSAANKFADDLSRRFLRGDLRVRKKLRCSVLAGMQARDVFKYRPLGEHPVLQRRQAYRQLEQPWHKNEVRLLCPPVDLIGPTIRKFTITKVPAVLFIIDWKRQPWNQDHTDSESSLRGLGSTTDNQSSIMLVAGGAMIAPPATRSEPPLTHSVGRMELATVGADRIRRFGQHPAAVSRCAELVADYAWSDRTTASRSSQWQAWTQFCEADGRSPLPLTEELMESFVGWLALERQARRRSVTTASISQYFSAVRQMKIVLTGISAPHYPFLTHVVRAYERWEGGTYPQAEVRMGINAPQSKGSGTWA